MHLLFPLAASLIFTFGALFVKHVSNEGGKPLTSVVIANWIAAALFSTFWFLGGEFPGYGQLWQPALVALFYLLGQCFILSAVNYGDVSVAMPVAGAKVLIVTFLLTALPWLFPNMGLPFTSPSSTTWIAALLATLGVLLINYVVPKEDRAHVLVTAVLAFVGASSFALFDVCVQTFSPDWGTGRLIPIAYGFVVVYSFFLLPWVDSKETIFQKLPKFSLFFGNFLVGVQALFLVYSLSTFNDAANINVVYSLRGLWGVVLAWIFASFFGGNEAGLPLKTMLARLCGAALLVVAVILVILQTPTT